MYRGRYGEVRAETVDDILNGHYYGYSEKIKLDIENVFDKLKKENRLLTDDQLTKLFTKLCVGASRSLIGGNYGEKILDIITERHLLSEKNVTLAI